MAEFLCESLVGVRSVKVKVRRIPQEELAVRAAKTKDVSCAAFWSSRQQCGPFVFCALNVVYK